MILPKKVKLLLFLLPAFVLVFPPRAAAMTFGEIFTSPESILVRIQERIEYALSFDTNKKVLVLGKHAERRLTYAQKRAAEGNDTQTAVLIKSYEGIKKKESLLLEEAPASVMGSVKEKMIEEQRTIEEIKDNVGDEVKNSIEETQKEVINGAIEVVKAKEGEGKAMEFAAKIVDVVAPDVVTEVIREDEGGGSEKAPGDDGQVVAPGGSGQPGTEVESGAPSVIVE